MGTGTFREFVEYTQILLWIARSAQYARYTRSAPDSTSLQKHNKYVLITAHCRESRPWIRHPTTQHSPYTNTYRCVHFNGHKRVWPHAITDLQLLLPNGRRAGVACVLLPIFVLLNVPKRPTPPRRRIPARITLCGAHWQTLSKR